MKRIYEEFQHVKLKDGREGAIVEIVGDQAAFFVDVGHDESTWDTVIVYPQDIEEE